ncbi:MAG: DinB family protein [Terriglobales bacterium]
MKYSFSAISDAQVPRARVAFLQHAIDTYASETNKVISVWAGFSDADLGHSPHPRSSSVADILKHQLLSERRFFAEFLGAPEPAPNQVLPQRLSVEDFRQRMLELALARLGFLAERDEEWWRTVVPFFDTRRERIWIFWRRVLHTAHHRTQLTVYLRLLDKPVPSTYGPTADVSWQGADPTTTVEAAGRKNKPESASK